MAGLQELVTAELSVLTAAVLAWTGWAVRRTMQRGETRIRDDTTEATERQLLRRDVDTLRRDLDALQRHWQSVREELGQVALILDRHEQWHARHDPLSPRGD